MAGKYSLESDSKLASEKHHETYPPILFTCIIFCRYLHRYFLPVLYLSSSWHTVPWIFLGWIWDWFFGPRWEGNGKQFQWIGFFGRCFLLKRGGQDKNYENAMYSMPISSIQYPQKWLNDLPMLKRFFQLKLNA